MEEDIKNNDRVYWNDEWNQSTKSLIENPIILQHTLMYNIMIDKINKELEKELYSEENLNKTFLPKEFDK